MGLGKHALAGPILAVASFTIPLALISLSAILSGWFNLYDNALSDLGHAVRSNVAPLFNLGLSLGGLLAALFAVKYLEEFNRILAYLAAASGYVLILIAVFDEVYGVLHFIVSVLFFVLLALLVLVYSLVLRSVKVVALAILAIALSTAVWVSHFTMKIPRGAAIPELVSISMAMPFYLHLAKNAAKYRRPLP